jgi:hypothetical protein
MGDKVASFVDHRNVHGVVDLASLPFGGLDVLRASSSVTIDVLCKEEECNRRSKVRLDISR